MLELMFFMLLLIGLNFYLLTRRYKRCPADKVLVVSGKTASGASSEIHKGGGTFVWPVIQEYAFLSLRPFTVKVSIRDAVNEDNHKTSITIKLIAAVGESDALLEKAAARLLSMETHQIAALTENIATGQIRLLIRGMTDEEIHLHHDKLIETLYGSIGDELQKVGLQLINVDLLETVGDQENITHSADA